LVEEEFLNGEMPKRKKREDRGGALENRMGLADRTGSIPASVGTVESEGARWSSVEDSRKKNPPKKYIKKEVLNKMKSKKVYVEEASSLTMWIKNIDSWRWIVNRKTMNNEQSITFNPPPPPIPSGSEKSVILPCVLVQGSPGRAGSLIFCPITARRGGGLTGRYGESA
jgi:hypothetical protein